MAFNFFQDYSKEKNVKTRLYLRILGGFEKVPSNIYSFQFRDRIAVKLRLEYLLKLHDGSTNSVLMPGIEPGP